MCQNWQLILYKIYNLATESLFTQEWPARFNGIVPKGVIIQIRDCFIPLTWAGFLELVSKILFLFCDNNNHNKI